MVSVSVFGRARETRDDDFRPEVTNDPHVIAENLIVVPLCECVFGGFRKAEFVVRREELFGVIQTPRGHQFLSPDDAQGFEQLRADEVHATFAACRG